MENGKSKFKSLVKKLGKEERWDLIDAIYFHSADYFKKHLATNYGKDWEEILEEAKERLSKVGLNWKNLEDYEPKEVIDENEEISDKRKKELINKIKSPKENLKKAVYVLSVLHTEGYSLDREIFSYSCSLVSGEGEEEIIRKLAKSGFGVQRTESTNYFHRKLWIMPQYVKDVLEKVGKNPEKFDIPVKSGEDIRSLYKKGVFQEFINKLEKLKFIPRDDYEELRKLFDEEHGEGRFEEICKNLLEAGALTISWPYERRRSRGKKERSPRKIQFSLTTKGQKIRQKFEEMGKIELEGGAFFFGRDHWRIFQRFIASADEKVDIATGSVSPESLERILEGMDKDVEIRIIYKQKTRGDYQGLKELIDLEGEDGKKCKRFHAKFCIIDDEKVLLGSSNITKQSLGVGGSSKVEAEVVSEDEEIVKDARRLFDIIWRGEDEEAIKQLDTHSNFLSSAYGIPTKVVKLFENCEEEAVIIVPSLFDRTEEEIIDNILELNPEIKIKIITNHIMPENHKEEVEAIREKENVEFIPVSDRIHSKVYLFDQERALISSVNLEYRSWRKSLEAGIITDKEKVIDEILNKIEGWKEKAIEIKISGEGRPTPPIKKGIPLPFEVEGERNSTEEIFSPTEEEGTGEGKGGKTGAEGRKKKEEEGTEKVEVELDRVKRDIKNGDFPESEVLGMTGKWREGKGFSELEVDKAKIEGRYRKVLRKKYIIDSRRRSYHKRNIEKLKNYFQIV